MPTVGFIERHISRLEGFNIRFRRPDGRDVRSDLELPRGYPFENAAAESNTVADWKRNRFYPYYPGFECSVLDKRGTPLPGMTLLSTVRRHYLKS